MVAKKRKTHRPNARGESTSIDTSRNPRSFVVKQGHVGVSVSQLVRDMRKVMEPNTASRLKERSANKLKDYLVMAPSLKVSHLLAFSLTDMAPSLRIARLPQGPTFSFRIERYSLIKDIINASRHPRNSLQAYMSPPLLVLASFPTGPNAPPHLTLAVKSFQSLFPPLTPKTISLTSARRVVLISYNSESQTMELRHYLISVRTQGVSRRVRRILEGTSKSASAMKIPDLGNEKDIADYVLKQAGEDGYETASTSAASDADPEEYAVKLAGDYVGRNNKKGDKRGVKLDEIGPRMELRLVKIVEGAPGKEGSVLHHEFVTKTAKQAAALKRTAAEKEKLRQQRRKEQEENIARKKKAAGDGDAEPDEEKFDEDGEMDEDEDEWDGEAAMSDGEDDDEPEASAAESSDEDEPSAPPPPRKRSKVDTSTSSKR